MARESGGFPLRELSWLVIVTIISFFSFFPFFGGELYEVPCILQVHLLVPTFSLHESTCPDLLSIFQPRTSYISAYFYMMTGDVGYELGPVLLVRVVCI